MRRLVFAFLVGLAACGGGNGTEPTPTSIAGTWIGNYTNTASPGIIFEGVLQLSQNGSEITGTLTTNAGPIR